MFIPADLAARLISAAKQARAGSPTNEGRHETADPRPGLHPARRARRGGAGFAPVGQRFPPAERRHPRPRAGHRRHRGMDEHATLPLQGCGHFAMEAAIRTFVARRRQAAHPRHRRLCRPGDPPGEARSGCDVVTLPVREKPNGPTRRRSTPPSHADPAIGHVALVYSETGSGIIHDVPALAADIAGRAGRPGDRGCRVRLRRLAAGVAHAADGGRRGVHRQQVPGGICPASPSPSRTDRAAGGMPGQRTAAGRSTWRTSTSTGCASAGAASASRRRPRSWRRSRRRWTCTTRKGAARRGWPATRRTCGCCMRARAGSACSPYLPEALQGPDRGQRPCSPGRIQPGRCRASWTR